MGTFPEELRVYGDNVLALGNALQWAVRTQSPQKQSNSEETKSQPSVNLSKPWKFPLFFQQKALLCGEEEGRAGTLLKPPF